MPAVPRGCGRNRCTAGIYHHAGFEQRAYPASCDELLYLLDHTILQRYREYDEDASANEKIFNFTTSSNNRDGLAIRAASLGLLEREEERKIMIILSDGRPYDVILNRPNGRNPQPYQGKYAVRDTGTEVRRLRNLGVSVLGVFAGEEKDLEQKKRSLAGTLPIFVIFPDFPASLVAI